MKRLLTIILLWLLPALNYGPAWAVNDTPSLLANSVYNLLNIDSTGVDGYARVLALRQAKDAMYKVGTDVGVPFTKSVTTTSLKSGVLIDTGLIWLSSVAVDSELFGTYTAIRALNQYESHQALLKSCSYNEMPPAGFVMASGYWWQPGSDSIVIGPVTPGTDTLTVTGYKLADYPADSTSSTNLPEEYRWSAVIWACHLASMSLENGRAAEFEQEYKRLIAEIWQKRLTGLPFGETAK